MWFSWGYTPLNLLDFSLLFCSVLFWYQDVLKETNTAQHNTLNRDCFKYSFLLFVFREVILFFSFFWLIFRNEFCPNPELGFRWLESWVSFNPKRVPLFNRTILLTRRITLTLFHFETLISKHSIKYLLLTISLGVYFLRIQYLEYIRNKITIRDASSCSTFYILTIFHACHVIVATFFLFLVIVSFLNKELTNIKNIIIDCSILYWHFVDVVWLFLFTFLYIWPKT